MANRTGTDETDRILGSNALFHDDAGRALDPSTPADWVDWVAASKTRNWVLNDPLLDWLHRFGRDRGFVPDDENPDYDSRCDFTDFILRQGRRFEATVVEHLQARTTVETIAHGTADILSPEKAVETFEAMRAGVPVIDQGVLRDPQHRVFGAPDLLVRSDYLAQLFPGSLGGPTDRAAPGLGGAPWHYRVVDVKFTTLRLRSGGELGNGGSLPAYKVQLFLYARALARVQGLTPPESYLLGRGWQQTSSGVTRRGANAFERLGPFPASGTLARGQSTSWTADQACEWIRSLRREGASWKVLPSPSRPELLPNLANTEDGPWHAAKRRIAVETEDLCLLWQVGPGARTLARDRGIVSWKDPACTPEALGVGDSYRATLHAILDVNRSTDGPAVRPTRVRAAESEWRPEPPLEFYVDFETVTDLGDDFSRFPEKGATPLVFLIGCGHVEDAEWHFERFLANELGEDAEARVIDAWLGHMESVRCPLDPDGVPRVVHWSGAEPINYETAYNSARERHPEKDWPALHWFDLLKKVFHAEPVVVRGAFGFGLKEIARALHGHGLIETVWEDSSLDGLGAMTGAWWCYGEAARSGIPLKDLDLVQEIVRYNEIDCRILLDVMRMLRREH